MIAWIGTTGIIASMARKPKRARYAQAGVAIMVNSSVMGVLYLAVVRGLPGFSGEVPESGLCFRMLLIRAGRR
ncbi:hypothetical protein Ade02nite_49510 [Paractinoplanes deccanensis]|uniref:Uncharacterized protein n=1 Tax=Paractinoplanes deccanensis TaxID=113561 RepID=A0ABQ3Y8H1_9ACTN|nr:hypothetical protein Ade02nite_49510 [Actinoplanes deccanensis]